MDQLNNNMISLQETEHIAKLARLEFSKTELAKMQQELANILDYIEQLNEVDITNVQPTSHPLTLTNVYRMDDADSQSPATVEAMLSQLPNKEGRHVKVKEILA